MPSPTWLVSASPIRSSDTGTPAFARAKTGRIRNALHGWSWVSILVKGDTASRDIRETSHAVSSLASECGSDLSLSSSLASALPVARRGCMAIAGVRNPSTTPAIVACTPDSYTASHRRPARPT